MAETYYESVFILIGTTRIDVNELSINISSDLTPYVTSDSKDPKEIRSGTNKYEFTMKRAHSSHVFLRIFQADCEFMLLVFNNTGDAPRLLFTLEGCKIGGDNFGPMNGQDISMEEVSGQGTRIRVGEEILPSIVKECQNI